MQILNNDTNAIVAGVPLPQGSFEVPFHGALGVITSQGSTTNISCQSGDTLVIWPTGAAVIEGYDIYAMMSWGICLAVSTFGVAACMRLLSKKLSNFIGVREP